MAEQKDLRIQAISRDDARAAGELIAALLRELSGSQIMSDAEATAVAKRILEERIGPSGFLATVDNERIAVLMLEECNTVYARGRFGEITELYVRPDFRARGVAGALMDRAVALATERGWSRLEVGAPPQPQWERSLKFYERYGFSTIGPRLSLRMERRERPSSGKTGAIVNSQCPWSGKPVVEDATTTYRGVRVGFCNTGCRDKFEQATRTFDLAIEQSLNGINGS
jgi:GNAT superfamily N-acetyltransferase